MSNTVTVTANFPPQRCSIGNTTSGTITNIAYGGTAKGTIYSAAGVALLSFDSTLVNVNNAPNGYLPVTTGQPGGMAVNVAFSGGAPYAVLTTPSSVTFTVG
ncbi:hypothetical protein PQQ75_04215 [Paraburkholderia aspalathi]|uniref:hypothetical protein n=1 Tax=Paraburkholderia aspalathi TaxID=1324617 RepID=UPI0038B7CB55